MVNIHNFLDFKGQNKRFFDCHFSIGYGQFDHGESENRGIMTLGSILRAPGQKTLKIQNFKVIISRFPDRFKPNRPRGILKIVVGRL